ncbi:uncharacterized protein LOC125516147 [Triticum urartu]|uniref:F-box protein AT5G49610-like beta-propeller domain-containing protein n=1 Tax=Triticum urartu TaxID=4572 RepID=A0A8R7RF34_TRIUA|nr:uncharacterized protein LOC125516122 [Triticum urartu]XP_048537583.1 uncharacterized protein LOC125516147 [Triticum urartu]
MSSQQSPSPAEAKSPRPPAPTTTVTALDDDLLREIFLRLHSLPTLVRAALSCRTFFHAVRSSPAFRRSFREVHPPPLLGLFFDPDGPSIPAFAPLRRRSDPDLAAVVRGADFFLTRLPDDDDDAAALPEWVIYDCRDGYILLEHGSLEQYAVYNPLTRALDLIPQPPDEIFDDQHGDASCLGCYILSSQEGGEPLRLVYTCHDESRARAAVFSSESREWQILPWSEPVRPLPEDEHWLKVGTMANGFVYWTHKNQAYILVLNTVTLQFSQMDVPPDLVDQDLMFKVGETKDGRPCIVCPIDFELHAWVWRAGQDGIETWIFDKKFSLETIVEVTEGTFEQHCELKVLAIIGGFVYFCTMDMLHDAIYPCWFLSLCMETGELGTLFRRRFDGHVYPYIMAWPPSLIDNKVNPQFEGA